VPQIEEWHHQYTGCIERLLICIERLSEEYSTTTKLLSFLGNCVTSTKRGGHREARRVDSPKRKLKQPSAQRWRPGKVKYPYSFRTVRSLDYHGMPLFIGFLTCGAAEEKESKIFNLCVVVSPPDPSLQQSINRAGIRTSLA